MTDIDAVLEQLLTDTGASRVTLRQDRPGAVFPVTHEALAPGTPSIRDLETPDMARQPVVLEVSRGRQVVQDDCLSASDEPHFQAMLELYGGLRAQIVTPVLHGDRVVGVVSLHQLGRTREWSPEEVEAAKRTALEVGALL